MANTLGNAVLKTAVDGTAMTSGLEKGKKEVQEWAKTTGADAHKAMQSAGGGKGILAGLTAGIGGGITAMIGAAIGGITAAIDDVMKRASEHIKMGRQAASLGIQSDDFEGLIVQGKRFNLTADDMRGALLKLQRQAFEAASGSKEAAKGFELLGLDAKKLVNESPYDALLEVADALKKMDNVGKQAAAGHEVLGRNFRALQPLLAKGADGIKEMNAKLKALGVTIGQGDMNQLMRDSMRVKEAQETWKMSLEGLKNAFMISVFPMIADCAELASKIMSGIVPAIKFMGEVFREVGPYLESIFKGICEEIADIGKELNIFGGDSIDVAGTVAKSFKFMADALNSFMVHLRKTRIEMYDMMQQAATWMGEHASGKIKFFVAGEEVTWELIKETMREASAVQKELLKTDFANVDAWMAKMAKQRQERMKDVKAAKQAQLDFAVPENKYTPVKAMMEGSKELYSFQAKWERDEADTKRVQEKQLDMQKAIRDAVKAVEDAVRSCFQLKVV